MVAIDELNVKDKPKWCPGCGNFSVLKIIKDAIVELQLNPHNVLLVSGIGQSSKLPHWIKVYGFHTIHGRSLPVATGVKLANDRLNVIVIGGDGDSYGMGMGHMVHAMRRNLNITLIVHNNQVYGLTKGQSSPTSGFGFKTPSTPFGSIENPVNPITIALSAGATFIARANAFDREKAVNLIVNAIKHKGFSLVDMIQYCVTYNKINTPKWFKDRGYYLEDENYNPDNKINAFEKGLEWGDRIPFGIFYREDKPTLEDNLPQISDLPLVEHDIKNINIDKLLEELV